MLMSSRKISLDRRSKNPLRGAIITAWQLAQFGMNGRQGRLDGCGTRSFRLPWELTGNRGVQSLAIYADLSFIPELSHCFAVLGSLRNCYECDLAKMFLHGFSNFVQRDVKVFASKVN